MGRIIKPVPCRLIVGAIYSNPQILTMAVREMEKKLGRVEMESEEFDFNHTEYYHEEMGDNLKRKFFALEKPVDRDQLVEIKHFTNKIEARYGEKVGDFVFRRVNLDPGLLTLANLVLASTKDFAHRIYLSEGIYAEITLIYEKKEFWALPWTYPDYTLTGALEFFQKIRGSMKGIGYDED